MNDFDTRNSVSALALATLKSPFLAALLAFFFGPIGLLYASVKGAIIMFLVCLGVGIVTLGFGLFITWPICAVWGYLAATKHNERIVALASGAF